MNTTQRDKAFDDGCRANRLGLNTAQNPYSDELGEDWQNGWESEDDRQTELAWAKGGRKT
jgi:hypothetical protein